MKPSVSIIIPTYKRLNSLLRLLTSLTKERKYILEIVVVEQVENHGREIRKVAKKANLPFRYMFLKSKSTAHAMNVGVANAKGKYILFLDDDVTMKSGMIRVHTAVFTDLHVVATVGRVITDGQKVEVHRTDTGRINWLGAVSDGFSSNIRQSVDTVIGCNTCWVKDIYIKLGGIDEQFTGNAMRLESDLSLRAKKFGYSIVFEPHAQVFHHREATGGARKTENRMQWFFDFFSNETYFFLKHRMHILLPIFLLTKIEWAVRCMFGFGREVSVRSMITPFAGIMDGVRKYNRRKI